jgi:hypothetical protein
MASYSKRLARTRNRNENGNLHRPDDPDDRVGQGLTDLLPLELFVLMGSGEGEVNCGQSRTARVRRLGT